MKKRNLAAICRICLIASFAVLLYVFVFVLGVTASWAYNWSPAIKWSSSGVSYILDTDTLTSSWRTAIKSADATWDAAGAGSAFRFTYAGTYTSTNSCPAYPYVYAGNAGNNGYPATTYTTYAGSTISWAYTQINTYYSYSIGGSATTYDLQSDMTHEFGHWLYLGHVTSTSSPTYCSTSSTRVNTSEATMCPYSALNRTHRRTLNSDDKNGISYIY